MKRVALALFLACGCLPLAAQVEPSRPPITGIARVRLYSTDLYKSREFYTHVLGLAHGIAGCIASERPCFTVNDHQQIELLQVTGGAPENLLAEIAFATPELQQMRDYLAAHKLNVTAITKDRIGVQHFELRDPEGHPLAFVQLPSQRFFTAPGEQVSTRMIHAGFIVKDRDAEDRFYRGLLGFRMYWHGAFPQAEHPATATDADDWYEIQVPDGSDWIEYMLNIPSNANKQERGVQNHFSLAVEKIQPTAARLRANGLKTDDQPEIGRDGKWSFDIYDPDLTRVEFMEYQPAQPPCCNPYSGPHPKP